MRCASAASKRSPVMRVAAQAAHAHRRAQLRHDRRRDHAPAHLGERKARRGGRERDVAARDHADAAAVACAVDEGERGPGEGVERAHGERRAARERHVVLERVACDLAQPGKISAGLEVLAVRAQNQQAHAAIGGERAHRLAQVLDHRAVVGVVHFWPVERKRGDPARVDRDQHQGLGHVDLPAGKPAIGCRCPLFWRPLSDASSRRARGHGAIGWGTAPEVGSGRSLSLRC